MECEEAAGCVSCFLHRNVPRDINNMGNNLEFTEISA